MLNHGMHTGSLESLHALILAYAPKLLDFDPPGYQARVQVAIMDHNHNYQRKLRLGEYSYEAKLCNTPYKFYPHKNKYGFYILKSHDGSVTNRYILGSCIMSTYM